MGPSVRQSVCQYQTKSDDHASLQNPRMARDSGRLTFRTVLETQRKTLEDQIARLELEYSMRSALANITETQVSGILKNFTENFRSIPKERWKESIRPLVEHIVLDPETLDCCIHYRIAVDDRPSMASPRGFEPLLPP